jgi:hypothetical protein
MSSIKWLAFGFICVGVFMIAMWLSRSAISQAIGLGQPQARRLVVGFTPPHPDPRDPESQYIAASSVERPAVVHQPPPRVIEPADPARSRPAMHSVNGVDGDRPPRPIPGLR